MSWFSDYWSALVLLLAAAMMIVSIFIKMRWYRHLLSMGVLSLAEHHEFRTHFPLHIHGAWLMEVIEKAFQEHKSIEETLSKRWRLEINEVGIIYIVLNSATSEAEKTSEITYKIECVAIDGDNFCYKLTRHKPVVGKRAGLIEGSCGLWDVPHEGFLGKLYWALLGALGVVLDPADFLDIDAYGGFLAHIIECAALEMSHGGGQSIAQTAKTRLPSAISLPSKRSNEVESHLSSNRR